MPCRHPRLVQVEDLSTILSVTCDLMQVLLLPGDDVLSFNQPRVSFPLVMLESDVVEKATHSPSLQRGKFSARAEFGRYLLDRGDLVPSKETVDARSQRAQREVAVPDFAPPLAFTCWALPRRCHNLSLGFFRLLPNLEDGAYTNAKQFADFDAGLLHSEAGLAGLGGRFVSHLNVRVHYQLPCNSVEDIAALMLLVEAPWRRRRGCTRLS